MNRTPKTVKWKGKVSFKRVKKAGRWGELSPMNWIYVTSVQETGYAKSHDTFSAADKDAKRLASSGLRARVNRLSSPASPTPKTRKTPKIYGR